MRICLTSRLTAALLLAAAMSASPARAQGPPGGPGGPGGSGGPGGPILMNEAVQKDIELTDKQKASLKKLQAAMQQKMRDGFQAAREEGMDPETMRESFGSLQRDYNTGIGKVLDKNQKARLAQIELQREGLLAVAKSDVATKIKLTPAQTKKVKTIVDEMRKTVFQSMPRPPGADGEGGAFPGGPPPGNNNEDGAPPAANKGATKKARNSTRKNNDNPPANGDTPPGDGDMPLPGGGGFPGGPPDGGFFGGFPGGPGGPGGEGGGPPGNRPDFNSEEFKAFFAKMRETQKKARKAASDKIGEVLTKEQSAAFEKLLGKPFDLAKLEPDAVEAKDKDKDKEADADKPKVEPTEPAAPKTKMRKRGGQ